MPQVPIYNGPQVRSAPLQQTMQRAPDVSSGLQAVGRGLQNVGEAIDQIDMRNAQDEAFKIEAQIRNDWQQQRAALRQQYKGEQADQYKAAADEWWTKARETYGADANPRARALAGKNIGQFMLSAQADTIGYVEGEKTRAREINFRTLQDTLVREAAETINPANAAAVSAVTSKRIRENAIAYAAANGMGSDVGESMARQQLDKYHATVALSLAGRPGGAEAAKSYLTEFGGEMDLADRERVMDRIEVESTRATTKAAKDMFGNLRLFVERGGFPSKKQVDDLAALDSNLAATLQSAINAERKAQRAEAGGASIKTDLGAYFKARDEILAGKPVDVLTYRDRVSRSDLEELKKMQEKLGKPAEQKRLFTEERTIDSYRPKGMDASDAKWLQLRRSLEDRLIEASNRKGGELSDVEMRKVLDDEFAEVVVGKTWYGSDDKKPRWQATPEERQTLQSQDKFTVGKVYKDGKGNRAKYLGNNKWEPM